MRFIKYKCTDRGQCLYSWDDSGHPFVCVYCGISAEESDTVWDKIRQYYWRLVPYKWRPTNIWYKIRGWAWDRYTTVKPRHLDHTWCDRKALINELVFETAARFIEEEGPKNDDEWRWQKFHNPAFYDSWIETYQLVSWWKNQKNRFTDKYEEEVRKNAIRLIELSPYYWT